MKPVISAKRWNPLSVAWFTLALCCLAVLLSAGPVFAATYYVRENGTGNGTSWDTASSDLAGILDSAVSGDEIWVAQGVYSPTEDSSDRYASFMLKNGVALYGGFPPTGSPNVWSRDIAEYVTVLTGDIDGNDSADQYGVVSTDCINGDNSYHVVYADTDVDETAVLDGFTVTGGKADHPTSNEGYGGGMYNTSSSPAVTNCTFCGNEAKGGGGMYNYWSSPTVTNCRFSGNVAEVGGGMDNSSSSPAVTNCTFSGNVAGYSGGGMYNRWSSPTVTNCTFSGNRTRRGGGMCNTDHSNPIVTNCTFSGNEAEEIGGGMCNENSDFSMIGPTVTNCTFSGNSAEDIGDGMFNTGFSPVVTNCIFWDEGSDEFDYWDVPTLSCCLVRRGDVAVLYETNDTLLASGDLVLLPLADNGGPTLTCALGTGSMAIDAGLTLDAVSTDQRGEARPSPTGGSFDIGAYEVEAWFTLTVTADLGGIVSVEPYGVILSGDMTSVSKDFTANDTPTFVITPGESMDLTGLWLDSGDVSFDAAGARITLDPLSCDHTLEVSFAAQTSGDFPDGDSGCNALTAPGLALLLLPLLGLMKKR